MSQESLVTILLAVGSWIISGTLTYGFMKAKLIEFERRMSINEADHKELRRDFMNHQLSCASHRKHSG